MNMTMIMNIFHPIGRVIFSEHPNVSTGYCKVLYRPMRGYLRYEKWQTADSDLSREDFYRIDAWSTEWTKIVTQHVEQQGDIGNFPKVESLQQMVDKLSDVCRKEQDRLRAMQPVEPSTATDSQIGPQ